MEYTKKSGLKNHTSTGNITEALIEPMLTLLVIKTKINPKHKQQRPTIQLTAKITPMDGATPFPA